MLFFDSWRGEKDDFYTARYQEINQEDDEVLDGKSYFCKYFPGNGIWSFLIKKEFIEKESLRFIEGHYCEDGMFVIDCISNASKCLYCHTDVYRYVCRKYTTTTLQDKTHILKMIDDFTFAIYYINRYINCEMKKNENKQYIRCLIRRRNSYTFFLQARMIKAKLDKKTRNKIISELKENSCYPYTSIGYRELKFKILERLFQIPAIYSMICSLYKLTVR